MGPRNPSHQAPTSQRLAYRPKELPAITGIGEGRIYRLIAEGRIKSFRIGSRIIVPAEALHEFLRGGDA
jgi:excisionase family DNA binding protein